MRKIIQLDDHLSNKIAAGEVVERPASVVKELVENAIDANSTVIEIDIEEAGLGKIRVIDNGTGIEPDDAVIAFARHATSKIKNENDLFRIRSLGFRGEALPSIASVAKLELKTCTGEQAGTRVVLEGGTVIATEKCASRKGTDIEVTDLFYNTPARLKYMRSLHTELGNITDVVNRLALAHADISFKLTHNGRVLLQTSGNGDARRVIAAIYGMNIAKKMIPIAAESLDFIVDGFISLPEVSRASRNYISIMINGRFIKNYSLSCAVIDGYHTLLPIGRFPIVLLNIQMDPILVDVNVHPTKLEVRMSKEKELQALVVGAIRHAFKEQTLIPAGSLPAKQEQQKVEQPSFSLDHIQAEQPKTYNHKTEQDEEIEQQFNKERETVVAEQRSIADKENSYFADLPIDQSMQVAEPNQLEKTAGLVVPDEQSTMNKIHNDRERIPPLYPIGQMHGTYIFAQNEHGLYMIDQHAAQERINYEFYKEKVGEVTNELQELLVPLTLEYSLDEYVKIEEHKNELEKVGVFLEPFGYNSYIVRAFPRWFPKNKEKETIEGMIEQILTMKKIDIKKLREEAAIMMSCKASIKANQHLRPDEIQALLDELRQTSDPFTCPHGRPIIIHYSTYELEKMFKRVM